MATARQRLALGAYGERIAAQHLARSGMKVLDRNWHCRGGELDLVLRDGEDLVVCEVKTRRGTDFGHPLAAVGDLKIARVRQAAMLWVEAHDVRAGTPIRLDLVGVLVPRRGPAVVEHVRGVG